MDILLAIIDSCLYLIDFGQYEMKSYKGFNQLIYNATLESLQVEIE
jgi:hypothetical protein